MNRLRVTLLSEIISSKTLFNYKYTSSFNALKGVITLEAKEDDKKKLNKSYFDRFKDIEKKYSNLDEKFKDIPLNVLEQYFFRNGQDLNKYIYIEYNNKSLDDVKIMDIFETLESYFMEIYLLAVEIADVYNLEIKLKKENNRKEEIL